MPDRFDTYAAADAAELARVRALPDEPEVTLTPFPDETSIAYYMQGVPHNAREWGEMNSSPTWTESFNKGDDK